ncbi:MAG TPA: glutamate synthase subunit alpha, partial [Halanaerobiales bacterium]|nr:glutamate synthase subunit alpha [Halanaerobiales bacterium]
MEYMFNELPRKQGLYDPCFEHDACGMGFVANIRGEKSHKIVEQGLEILINLAHRGATGSEADTGDGAGILIQIPHSFFVKEGARLDFSLPSQGGYGVGMVFLPQQELQRRECEAIIERIISEEGLTLLGWRTVPVNDKKIGETARGSMPYIRQVFVGRNKDLVDDLAFERKLYIIRKRLENSEENIGGISSSKPLKDHIYIASLSHRTIVYKGMLMPEQLGIFFPDLSDSLFETAVALVHSRFSTNTFPSWQRAHPNRYIIHNGEINTLRGNVNWFFARQSVLESELFDGELDKLFPIIKADGSDSAVFDNCLEFLTLAGYSLPHAVMMMVPEPWDNHNKMDEGKKDFYKYHSCLMEPWDGPAAMAFTDGVRAGAVLDRNGLRPSRYYLTDDGLVILASEVGVLDIPESKIISKQRLEPGRMLLVDTEKGQIINDKELKDEIAAEKPYGKWLKDYFVELEDIPVSIDKAG